MKELNIVICIDDVHPQKNWQIQGDKSEGFLESLNKSFGAKFNLFIPSYYHGLTPLHLYRGWIDWLKSAGYFELCAHGHFHSCKNSMLGEQEFLELDYTEAKERVELMLNEWSRVGITPKGFRMPGWGCSQGAAQAVGESFKYVAAHADINFNINFPTKTFYGCDGIHENSQMTIQENNLIVFQSHIFGDWNKNVWNEKNYENFYSVLDYLNGSFKVNFTTFDSLI
jgi:predicted deacetylase